jgi:hypothetical protein
MLYCAMYVQHSGKRDFDEEQVRVSRMNILVATPGRLLQHLEQTPGFDATQLQVSYTSSFTQYVYTTLHYSHTFGVLVLYRVYRLFFLYSVVVQECGVNSDACNERTVGAAATPCTDSRTLTLECYFEHSLCTYNGGTRACLISAALRCSHSSNSCSVSI